MFLKNLRDPRADTLHSDPRGQGSGAGDYVRPLTTYDSKEEQAFG